MGKIRDQDVEISTNDIAIFYITNQTDSKTDDQ